MEDTILLIIYLTAFATTLFLAAALGTAHEIIAQYRRNRAKKKKTKGNSEILLGNRVLHIPKQGNKGD